MRIVAGLWRGRALVAPKGEATRPTADRVRQALFDMLLHAPWAKGADGREAVVGATVLDAFAGTGALGLEALSRGAAHAHFLERDRAALAALRGNIAALKAPATVHAADATRPPPGTPCTLVFLDPPYGQGLIERALPALAQGGWLAAGALIVAETARDEPLALAADILAERPHGAARITILRHLP
jgi:16S rRNA (guanine966-N2)-methyltransferase